MAKWQWIWQQMSRRLWLRASMFCLAGVMSALAGVLFGGYLPADLSQKIGANAVGDILNIIASSMLAVTTFSLSIMVSAYASAANSATPRASRLLLSDRHSQNALSTFIGSFLFSLVGIVALKMEIYGAAGRLILFVVTVSVIALVVVTLLRWIEYLSNLGRVGHTINIVEKTAGDVLRAYVRHPAMAAVPEDGYDPAGSDVTVTHEVIGYLQHIDVIKLQQLAEKHKTTVHLAARPGIFNDGRRPLAYIKGAVGEDMDALRAAFTFSDDRSFDQDPRFGIIVLSEIASRALSPAVNDPGTAIDVIGTQVRLLSLLAAPAREEPEYDRVFAPVITLRDFFQDAFMAIARDGAGMVEVGIRLQKSFAMLAGMHPDFAAEARALSAYARKLGDHSLPLDENKQAIAALALT